MYIIKFLPILFPNNYRDFQITTLHSKDSRRSIQIICSFKTDRRFMRNMRLLFKFWLVKPFLIGSMELSFITPFFLLVKILMYHTVLTFYWKYSIWHLSSNPTPPTRREVIQTSSVYIYICFPCKTLCHHLLIRKGRKKNIKWRTLVLEYYNSVRIEKEQGSIKRYLIR